MALQQRAPSEYVAHNPADLHLPSVPQTAISRPYVQAEITLPDLKTVLSNDFQHVSPTLDSHGIGARYGSPACSSQLPPIDPGRPYKDGRMNGVEPAMTSPSEVGSAMSMEERGMRSTSVVSIDDPDVRIAAEALSGLGKLDFARPRHEGVSHASPRSSFNGSQQEPEPLLQLFTRSHPWVGGTINGSLSAYSTTKYYSPRLVQYGANLVEKNLTTPVVSTVSTVGRMTGVESGLRWYYGGQQSRNNDLERGELDPRDRTAGDHEMDVEYGPLTPAGVRRDSQESLPAYRGSKPPSYREEASPPGSRRPLLRQEHQRSWSSQVFVATSGLGVALSVTSRRSLGYCLHILGQAAEHVSTLMDALRLVLEQYDQARDAWHQGHDSALEKGERPQTPDHDEASRRLAELLKRHSDEIWHTMEQVVNAISSAAGGALPDNARQFVRNQLMSLPQRWRFVSDNQIGESETSRSAHRMIAFATEGLDVIGQVSQTVKLTLESAERWLQRTGQRKEFDGSAQKFSEDHSMEDAEPRRTSNEKA